MKTVTKNDKEFVVIQDKSKLPHNFLNDVQYYKEKIDEEGKVLVSKTIYEIEMNIRDDK